MAFKFEFPVKFARWTKEDFDIKRRDYTAKHGYEVHIPGFSEIFRWETWKEPNDQELHYYKTGNVAALGEKRFEDIKKLMKAKRENFLRILASPSPRFLMNSASVLTMLDDVQDTMSTLAVVARTASFLLPKAARGFLSGPAGWALTAADVMNVAVQLSRLPWKALRLQHELHSIASSNPLSKKAKVRRLNRLKRLRLSKGEIIEALQTTDNVFGYGVKLGPIAGLIYDIPMGFYRAFQGRKVKVTGLPTPFYWVDQQVSRFFRGCAQLWYGNPTIDDRVLGQSMVALNYATQWQRAYFGDTMPLDYIDDPSGIEVPVPQPRHPSTIDVIKSEVGSIEDYSGWPMTNSMWMGTNVPWDHYGDEIQNNIKSWTERNKRSLEGYLCIQNAIESGMNVLSNLEGEDAVEWTYDSVPLALLKMFNCNYRIPLDVPDDKIECFTRHLSAYGAAGIEPDIKEILAAAKLHCGFELTTEVPGRPSGSFADLVAKHKGGLKRLQKWYFSKVMLYSWRLCARRHRYHPYQIEWMEKEVSKKSAWLSYYGYPEGEPETRLEPLHPDLRACIEKYLG